MVIWEKFTSRKFWLAILAAVIPVLNKELGINLPTEVILGIFAVILAYIFGESMVDKERAKNGL